MPAAKGMAALAIGVTVIAGTTAGAASTPDHERARCAGLRADVVGTQKADVIHLKRGRRHVVAALDGADRIVGTSARDVICGGPGGDRIFGGGGSDRIVADGGADRIAAGGGSDTVAAGDGRDKVSGGSGSDLLRGGGDADVIGSGAGNDRVEPGGAKDRASAGKGDDVMLGGKGNDRLSGGPGDDRVVGEIGRDRLRGGAGSDELIGANDSDRIKGGSGDDRISGGPGPDALDAGGGADNVAADEGRDQVYGGDGEDLILAGAGGDSVKGGRGADRLFGQLLDDTLAGGPGDDLIVGGHGVDSIHGEDGNDWLRGDANKDFYLGGSGSDTVSYATATPPGPEPGLSGVLVDLARHRALEDPPQALRNVADPAEYVGEIENVVGSAFDDRLTGAGGGTAEGLAGSETCFGFASSACGSQAATTASASLEGLRDPGLLVRDDPGGSPSSITLSATSSAFVVSASVPLAPGPGCGGVDVSTVSCPRPAAPLGFAVLWSGGASDQLNLGEGFPATAVVLLDGGDGDDRIAGSYGQEILLGGPSGADLLLGGGGDDALFTGPGGDVLDGGDGTDQLVTSTPCDGHDFRGGRGDGDIAGFAQTIERAVQATLSGTAVAVGQDPCAPTLVRPENEVLEGTQNDDILSGDARDNHLILGKQGNDVIYGRGGADNLRGEQGRDTLIGGGGSDRLEALDGEPDAILHCGPGGDQVQRDLVDPPASNCRSGATKAKRSGGHRHKRDGRKREKGR